MASPDTAAAPFQVLRRLGSGPRGLTEEEAGDRLVRYGPNTPPPPRARHGLLVLAQGLRDPFTAVLLCLVPVAAAVGALGTAGVTAALVAVSLVLRAFGEGRGRRSAAALRAVVAGTAAVRRRQTPGGAARVREVPVSELVPGDVVLLGPGDQVPADLRLLRTHGLRVYQAALTGESDAVAKTAVGFPASATPDGRRPRPTALDAPGLCLQGASVAAGTATGVVLATGADTRLAGAWRAPAGRRMPSAFDRSVRAIAWTLVRFMLVIPPLVLAADALVQGRGAQTLPFAVAVAVGLTPGMLPVVTTLAPARAAGRLAREHGVIVNRLSALHDLGGTEVLCVDKTGTLTLDRPVVRGSLGPDGDPDPEVLRWAAVAAAWTLELAQLPAPAPLDAAVLAAAVAEGHDPFGAEGVDALPFDPERRLALAVVRTPGVAGGHTLVVNGAVESVLDRCALSPGQRAHLEDRVRAAADGGLRLLAVALGERAARTRPYTPADVRGLRLLGFVTLRDEPAPSAGAALRALERQGIDVRVLTGDQPETAARACRELGLDPGPVASAAELDALPAPARDELVARTRVFARCSPADKARILGLLRASGRTTGFLGDGVNDVPALRAADVGLCPSGAVDLARESADLVLSGKDLTAVGHAVTAGRRSTSTVLGYLRLTLSANLGNVLSMLVAGLLLPFLPMLPAQVLVQNLCFDAVQLAFVGRGARPRASAGPAVLRVPGLLRSVVRFGLLNAAADLATFGVLACALRGGGAWGEVGFHSGWFTENLLSQAVFLVLLGGSRLARGPLLRAAGALAGAGVLLPLGPAGAALGLVPLPGPYYAVVGAGCGAAGAVVLLLRGRARRPGRQRRL
ncbi:HAD-IC family P-type ATPase [Streptomyces sp. NPDC007088]|uniref:HAD-IC family P-type ATPase n=1 Tax=Streptomyces sp. NPDC007088 TaxID=3364773 RepID=UPI003686ACC0